MSSSWQDLEAFDHCSLSTEAGANRSFAERPLALSNGCQDTINALAWNNGLDYQNLRLFACYTTVIHCSMPTVTSPT